MCGHRQITGTVSRAAAVLLALGLCCAAAVRAEDEPASAFAAAETKFQQKEYESALDGYRAFLEKYPNDWRASQARFTSAFILQKKLNQAAKAREAYASVIEKNANAPIAKSAQYHIAESYEQAGDAKKAIGSYEELLKKEPRHPRNKGLEKHIEFLRQIIDGNTAVTPPGWAGKLERKRWRKQEHQEKQDPERGDKAEGNEKRDDRRDEKRAKRQKRAEEPED